ncbi:hypothetical protein PoB_003399300 [Plakobranchus ocellatus]|uniref:Uncharacterized protein n=1 Tax=Plakobranchus ocellatus TaxID=259542 RepID=A0AAV4AL22_9GAST|nr:hypothetical protein PoB_003399300 [Plakobranchus ocellatus]
MTIIVIIDEVNDDDDDGGELENNDDGGVGDYGGSYDEDNHDNSDNNGNDYDVGDGVNDEDDDDDDDGSEAVTADSCVKKADRSIMRASVSRVNAEAWSPVYCMARRRNFRFVFGAVFMATLTCRQRISFRDLVAHPEGGYGQFPT